ncbi:hypothetical protein GE061_018592 [Apolygus lucorum]|uniref:Uncharacterized protein n=1 Tax=Apolygus lucorum TaxID=248454 RepID=A0A8S9XGC7_APOLU|nr:hypothetical protein GE061_018592 [Apolygus lucorum]
MVSLATILKENHNPAIVIDWLMMNALSLAAPPSVKKVIIQMRSDYKKYADRNSHSYRSFTNWLGSLPAESYTMSTTPGDQMEWMAFVEGCYTTCGTLTSPLGSTIPPGPSTTSTSSTCASGTRGRGGAAAEACGASPSIRTVASSGTQTETLETSTISCSIFSRRADGSSSRRPLTPSGSTYVSIQVGSLHNLQDVPTRDWWRHMDLNSRFLIDLTQEDHPMSWRMRGLIDYLHNLANSQL